MADQKSFKEKVASESLASPGQKDMLETHSALKLLTETQEQRITDLENLSKRLQADFENFRKQTEKEKSEMQLHMHAAFVRKLLPLFDEFGHSLEAAKTHNAGKEVLHGFDMVYTNLFKLLQQEGLKEMRVGHESFDPYQHEALRSEESEFEEGKVVSVLRKGYYFRNHVLRPAAVVVSKGKRNPANAGGKKESEKGA